MTYIDRIDVGLRGRSVRSGFATSSLPWRTKPSEPAFRSPRSIFCIWRSGLWRIPPAWGPEATIASHEPGPRDKARAARPGGAAQAGMPTSLLCLWNRLSRFRTGTIYRNELPEIRLAGIAPHHPLAVEVVANVGDALLHHPAPLAGI